MNDTRPERPMRRRLRSCEGLEFLGDGDKDFDIGELVEDPAVNYGVREGVNQVDGD